MTEHLYYKIRLSNPPVEGFFTTVRLESKHYDALEGKEGCIINLEYFKRDGQLETTTAKVVSLDYLRFADIPEAIIASNYDSSCHYYKGLSRDMHRAYGDDFSEESWVTVIGLRLCQNPGHPLWL